VRDFLDKIEPAHDLTFFCFFPDFLEMDDRRELEGSIDGMWTSIMLIFGLGGPDVCGAISGDLSTEVELTGRERLGEELPDAVSWPKKLHFFLGLDDAAKAISSSNGIEPRLGDAQVSIDCGTFLIGSGSAPAVFGLKSAARRLGDGSARRSLFGGVEFPPDTIELKDPDNE
jgi:hypothetical protein